MESKADEFILPVPENNRREKQDCDDKSDVGLLSLEPGTVEKKDI